MTSLVVELGDAADPYGCRCCGERTYMACGLVFHLGSAHAVYFASWCEGHRDRGVAMAVSIGDWAEGATPADRVSMGLSARLERPRVLFDVMSPDISPWGSYAFIGPMLPAADARAHPHLEAYLDVARAAVRQDPRVRSYLKCLADNEQGLSDP